MILDRMIARLVEDSFREGWAAGYSAGLREDPASGTYWCDEETDWRESEAAKAIEARRAETTKIGSVEDESAVAASDLPKSREGNSND